MTNEDMNPLYKGRYISAISEGREMFTLWLDEGTVLIEQHPDEAIRIYFQLAHESKFSIYSADSTLWAVPGSEVVVVNDGKVLAGLRLDKGVNSRYVKIPQDDEFEFYTKQNTV